MWCSAKVSSHQQEAWGGRVSWKVQTACAWTHTAVAYAHMHFHIQAEEERLMGCARSRGCHRSQQVTVGDHFLWVTVLTSQLHPLTNNGTKFNMKSNTICGFSVEFLSSNPRYIEWNEFKILELLCLLFHQAESDGLCICLQYCGHTPIWVPTFPQTKGVGGISGSVPNFPQPPGSNQII